MRCLLHLKRYAAGRDELEALLATRGLSMQRSRPALLMRLLSVQLRLWGWQLLPDVWGRRAPSASDREWLDLLELMMSIVITSWPLDGAEYALRYRLVARRLHGEGGLRAVCMQIIQHTLLYCPDARKQARLMRRVDHLEATHDAASLDAVSRCLLPYARGAIALHSDPAAAHAHLRAAIAILDAAGWVEAYEAATSRCIAVWAAEAAGLYLDGQALCRDLLRFPTSLVALVTIPFEVRLHLARAELDPARARLDAWESVLPSDVSTTEHFWLRLLRAQVAVAAGDLDETILAVLGRLRREARWTGDLLPSWPRSHFFVISLDARLALASRGLLSGRELRRTRKMASALARRGWSTLRAAGLRALGVLALLRGDRSRARTLVARALTQARRCGGPWQTWLCLRVAHALADPADRTALEAELTTLEHTHGFAPSGLVAYERLVR